MRNRKRITNVIFLTLMISSICFCNTLLYAYQTKAARDHETIHFTIAKEDYSRIVVSGDRISSIKGQGSLYEIKEFKGESDEGIIFIRPTSFATESFSVFITTELGHHYVLRLSIKNCAAETIEVKPLTPIKVQASRWEQNTPYTQTLVELLRAMVNSTSPEGYAVIDFDKNKPEQIACGVEMRLLKIYRGGALTGEIWQLTNCTNDVVQLVPKYFYKKGVRAISFAQETLRPREHTILYRIISL